MVTEIKLFGEIVPKKNSRITLRNGRTIPSARYSEWRKKSLVQIKQQSVKAIDCSKPLSLNVKICHKDNRRRDADNALSSILDLLQDAHIITDDCWQVVRDIHITNSYCDEALAIITIERV